MANRVLASSVMRDQYRPNEWAARYV